MVAIDCKPRNIDIVMYPVNVVRFALETWKKLLMQIKTGETGLDCHICIFLNIPIFNDKGLYMQRLLITLPYSGSNLKSHYGLIFTNKVMLN